MNFATDLRAGWNAATPRRQMLTLAAVVAIAAVLPYLNALGNQFAYDDNFIVLKNARVHDWRQWRQIWLTPYWPQLGNVLGLYRPLTIFLFAVQWAVGGGSPWLFHLVNILLHGIVSVLLFLLLCRIAPRLPAAFGAIIFAVHPLHTEAVANIVGQAELTAAAFGLGACLVHAARPDGTAVSWTRRAAITLLYALALLAKESAVMIPGLLVLLDFIQRRVQLDARGIRRYAADMAMVVFLCTAVLVSYLILRFDALGGTLIGLDAGPGFPYLKEHRLLNAFRAFPEYLRLLFWPADLTIDYAPATIFAVESLTLMSAFGAIMLAGMVVLGATTPWIPVAGGAAAWFLISISPVSNLFFPIGVLIAERTLYMPSAAVAVLIALVAPGLAAATRSQKRVLAAAFACAIIALAGRTWTRNPVWMNSTTVQNKLFEDHPESYHAQWAQALSAWDRSQFEQAEFWWKLAFKTYPRDSGMLTTYGGFLTAIGKDSEALPLVERSHEIHAFMPNTKALLAYLYLTHRRFPEALEVLGQAEAQNFPATITNAIRAYAYQGMGQTERAANVWGQTARRITISKWLAHAYHARGLAFLGQDARAVDAIELGLKVVPDSASAQVLIALRKAVEDGCYQTVDPVRMDDLYGPPQTPSCDPLGSWFDRMASVQGATFSQFAIPRRLRPVANRPPI
jgi:Tfp pilus assembly protein PilF